MAVEANRSESAMNDDEVGVGAIEMAVEASRSESAMNDDEGVGGVCSGHTFDIMDAFMAIDVERTSTPKRGCSPTPDLTCSPSTSPRPSGVLTLARPQKSTLMTDCIKF